MPASRWWSSPPTGPPGCAAPAPTRPPTRSASSDPLVETADVASPAEAPRPRPRGVMSATSTSSSTTRSCPMTAGLPRRSRGSSRTAVLDDSGRRLVHRRHHPRARAPSWSRATTPARPRGCSPRTAAGRCSPSPAAARAPARTPCAATGCCSTATSVGGIERVVVFGHPTLSRPVDPAARPRRRRGLAAGPAGCGPGARSAWTASSTRPCPTRRARRRRPGLARRVAGGRRRGRPPARRAARRRGRPRRTASPGWSAAPCRATGCCSWAPPARSATST